MSYRHLLAINTVTGSCSVAISKGTILLTQKKVVVDLDGGQLEINWQSDGVWMTGETAHSFDGRLTQEFLMI